MSIPNLFITTIVLAVATRAAPQWPVPTWPQSYFCPVVEDRWEDVGTPWQIGTNVAGGVEVNIGETHTEGIEWSKGGDIGISAGELLSFGGSWSVAESVEDSFTAGAAGECPDGEWRCSVVITPSMLHVKGHLDRMGQDDKGCENEIITAQDGRWPDLEFEYLIPMADKSGNAIISVDLCTCQNRENWADPGHPEILCPENCGMESN